MSIRERFESVGFTPEEKLDLTARLERAAEQEDNMTSATKRKIKRISGGMVFGVAAAVMMTAGALAAVLNPGLRGWFDTQTYGTQEKLEQGIYRLDRSQTYNGWTISLGECVGDDNSVYIWGDVAAPEGTVLAFPEDSGLRAACQMEGQTGRLGSIGAYFMDHDPTDNHVSMLIKPLVTWGESPRGETVTLRLGPVVDDWTTYDPETGEGEWHTEGSELTAAIRGHEWVFEDLTLDYPDQTIRIEPNVEVPWLNGTTNVTHLEVSPLGTYVTLEGGSCGEYVAHMNTDPTSEGGETISSGGLTITFGGSDGGWEEKSYEMERSVTLELTLRDGTQLTPGNCKASKSDYKEGLEGPETPYYFFGRTYDGNNAANPTSVLDPTQVDHVTVCGVDIPLTSQEDGGGSAAPEQTAKPSAMEGVVNAKKGLNVRSGPGTRFRVLTAIPKGTRLDILGEESGFYQVSLSGGKIGYASKNHILVE